MLCEFIAIILHQFNNGKTDVIEVETTIKSSELEIKLQSDPPTIINNIYPLKESSDNKSKTEPQKSNIKAHK